MSQWVVYNHTNDPVYRCFAENEEDACRQALRSGCLDVAFALKKVPK